LGYVSSHWSISASVIFHEHPEVKKELWGGEFWEDGYFARTVGDKVTTEVIRNYIKYHREQEKTPKQLELFQDAPPCGRGTSLSYDTRSLTLPVKNVESNFNNNTL